MRRRHHGARPQLRGIGRDGGLKRPPTRAYTHVEEADALTIDRRRFIAAAAGTLLLPALGCAEERRPTMLFNGYGEQVAKLYKGTDLIKNH